MNAIGRSFSAHPARLAGALLTFAALSVIVWYLASPLLVRTYRNEVLPVGPAGRERWTRNDRVGDNDAPRRAGRAVGRAGLRGRDTQREGPVRIVQVGAQRFVRFEDVMLTNAPDVHVYLSRESGGRWDEATSLYLGALKATNGSFNYELPATADVASYHCVVVWCCAFRVLITWADLSAAG